jgi:transposase-like protein
MTQAENRQKWEARVAAYQASGQSSAEWCAAHQIERRQLWYWLRKFKNIKDTVAPDSQWVSVNVDKQLEGQNRPCSSG